MEHEGTHAAAMTRPSTSKYLLSSRAHDSELAAVRKHSSDVAHISGDHEDDRRDGEQEEGATEGEAPAREADGRAGMELTTKVGMGMNVEAGENSVWSEMEVEEVTVDDLFFLTCGRDRRDDFARALAEPTFLYDPRRPPASAPSARAYALLRTQ